MHDRHALQYDQWQIETSHRNHGPRVRTRSEVVKLASRQSDPSGSMHEVWATRRQGKMLQQVEKSIETWPLAQRKEGRDTTTVHYLMMENG